MSQFTFVDITRVRDSIHIHSLVNPEKLNCVEVMQDQDGVAEALEHHAGLLILIGTVTLAVMASFAMLIILQILID